MLNVEILISSKLLVATGSRHASAIEMCQQFLKRRCCCHSLKGPARIAPPAWMTRCVPGTRVPKLLWGPSCVAPGGAFPYCSTRCSLPCAALGLAWLGLPLAWLRLGGCRVATRTRQRHRSRRDCCELPSDPACVRLSLRICRNGVLS